ncbi:MAG: hypothetical protein E7612_08445 [Ruminococcaceae bacterium]|nr:hypothetical protein [Oscillospiraceae bacterium]
MKFINIDYAAPREEVISMLLNNEAVNRNVRVDSSRGRHVITVEEKTKNRIKLKCKLVGGPSKDNGFVQGTTLNAKIVEKNGITKIRGVIVTEPVYHFFFFMMIVLFIVQCIRMRGISIIPPMLIIFDIFMFKNEFKKQKYIKSYLYRAKRILGSLDDA